MIISTVQNSFSNSQQLRNVVNNDWLVLVIIVLLLIYIIIERVRPTYMYSIVIKGLTSTVSRISMKVWKSRNLNLLILLIGCLVINISILLMYCVKLWDLSFVNSDTSNQFFFFLFLVSLYLALKISVYKLLGYLFDIRELTKEYLSNKYLQFQIYAIILFPFSCLIPFVQPKLYPILVITELILLFIIHIISILRSLSVFTVHKFSKFYMILYLCALEILPILLVGKVFFL